jgi:hypothetical protein
MQKQHRTLVLLGTYVYAAGMLILVATIVVATALPAWAVPQIGPGKCLAGGACNRCNVPQPPGPNPTWCGTVNSNGTPNFGTCHTDANNDPYNCVPDCLHHCSLTMERDRNQPDNPNAPMQWYCDCY